MNEFGGFVIIVILSLIGLVIYKYHETIEEIVKGVYAIAVILCIAATIIAIIAAILINLFDISERNASIVGLILLVLTILYNVLEEQPTQEDVDNIAKFCKEEDLLMISLFERLNKINVNISQLEVMKREANEIVLLDKNLSNTAIDNAYRDRLRAPFIYYKNFLADNNG